MEHGFWHQRWQQNQIGFHRDEIEPALQQEWSKLAILPGSRVFVPLCGKTNDMLWLLNQGYQVVGVELSPLAVAAFFTENNLQPTVHQQGAFLLHQINGLQILCADFFALLPADLGKIDAVYDRGSLVALPPQMRIDYAAQMSVLLQPATKTLLLTLEYQQQEMSGPPFSINSEEVAKLYQTWCEIELLANADVLEQEPHFKNRGLSRLQERVYKLVCLGYS
jgi:thiopurine S-methyltransferase